MITANLRQQKSVEAVRVKQYACPADFCRVFAEEMQSLYQLSFLITANHKKAETCFLKSLDECFRTKVVFKESVSSLARQAIIKNSVTSLISSPSESIEEFLIPEPCMNDQVSLGLQEGNIAISSIFFLEDFERAIFVLCVLERYSELNCATLLGCSQNAIREGRNRALQQAVDHQLRNTMAKDAVAIA